MKLRKLLCAVGLLLAACGAEEATGTSADNLEEASLHGSFVASPDDETVDPSDPPNDPNPVDADDDDLVAIGTGSVSTQTLHTTNDNIRAPAPVRCIKREALSPRGLSFVIHVSKNGENARRALDHLRNIRRFIRARDLFMVEERSPVLDQLHDLFPCNRFHFIAYPDEMQRALDTGDRMEGIAVDWEGSHVEGNSSAYSVDRLNDYVRRIRNAGKKPGFVPAWTSRFDDAAITRASKMDYEIAQIQGSCVNEPAAFARQARKLVGDFRDQGLGIRNIGFEISMMSYVIADNHVNAARAAACTRAAYGKGARSIYLYGNGQDHLPEYFHALGRMGVRTPK